jgi:NitT/TauT family transport system ATP-binding protein
MHNLFPSVSETSKIRGILEIIKQNNDVIELSKLADEAEIDIDFLMPLVEACKMLGFATIDESEIKLTATGRKVTPGNMSKLLRERLPKLEPFRSAISILRRSSLTTEELFRKLSEQGVTLDGDVDTNFVQMKKMLLRFGVRTKLLEYDSDTDTWSTFHAHR